MDNKSRAGIDNYISRIFEKDFPYVHLYFLISFVLLSLWRIELFDVFVLALFFVVATIAIIGQRGLDFSILFLFYLIFRFNLIDSNILFRYGTDMIAAVIVLYLATLILRKKAKVKWFDLVVIFYGLFYLGWSLFNGVPILPTFIELRALFVLYPAYWFIRELDKEYTGKTYSIVFLTKTMAWLFAIQAIIEKLTEKEILSTVWLKIRADGLSVTNFPRVYGWTANPNSLGAVCVLSLILIVYLIFIGVNKKKLFMPSILFSVVLFLTISRSAWLGLVLVLGFMYFNKEISYSKRKEFLKFLIKSIVIGFAIGLVVVQVAKLEPKKLVKDVFQKKAGHKSTQAYSRLTSFVGEKEMESSASGGRLFYARKAIEISTDKVTNTLFGTGLATFGTSGSFFWNPPQYSKYGLPTKRKFYSDSFYLALLVEQGILGVFLFFIFTLAVLFYNRKKPWIIRGSVFLLFYFLSLFYNVIELQFLWFSILLLGGTTLLRKKTAG